MDVMRQIWHIYFGGKLHQQEWGSLSHHCKDLWGSKDNKNHHGFATQGFVISF